MSSRWLVLILPILRQRPFRLLSVAAGCMFALALSVVLPALLGRCLEGVVSAATNSGHLARLLALLVGAGLLRSLAGYISRMGLYRISYDVEIGLRVRLFNHICCLPVAFHDKVQTGQLVARANADVRSIQIYLVLAPFVVLGLIGVALMLAYMFSVQPLLTIVAVLPLSLTFYLGRRLRQRSFALSWLIQSRIAEIVTLVDETLRGLLLVRTLGREAWQLKRLTQRARALKWGNLQLVREQARCGPWLESTVGISQLLVLAFGGWLVTRGELGLGDLTSFSLYIVLMQIPFRMLGVLIVQERRAASASTRIEELLAVAPARDPDAGDELCSRLESIELEDVRFHHGTPASGGLRPGLNGVSLRLRTGDFVGVVGATGCGKSTLISLLMGFFEPDGGRILINGQDRTGLAPRSVRREIAVASGEPFLCALSVEENLAYGNPSADVDSIRAAARHAEADGFIVGLAQGYHTTLASRGMTLSGGQRQRIGIAQALAGDPACLLLDQATSAVDPETEQKIFSALRRRSRGMITVVVTDRPAVLKLMDRVLFMHAGRIVAEGTHVCLLEREPRYRGLLQASGTALSPPEVDETDDEYFARVRARVHAPSLPAIQPEVVIL